MTTFSWQPIKHISTTNVGSSGPFIYGLRQTMAELNMKIQAYNTARTKKEKLTMLRVVYFEARQINEQYPAPLLERHHKGYQLFLNDLPKQFASLGIEMLNTPLLSEQKEPSKSHPTFNAKFFTHKSIKTHDEESWKDSDTPHL